MSIKYLKQQIQKCDELALNISQFYSLIKQDIRVYSKS